jgi:flavin-dependent dehydrogenase
MVRKSVQILVVGGGPAGSTAATLLARQGFSVMLLERDHFPRYHIGESLLPSCLPVLDLLGVRDKVEAFGFQRKGGAYYAWGEENWELRFSEIFGAEYSWQVRRADFDRLLLEHARSEGVEVHEGVTVRQISFDGERAVSATWERAGGEGEEAASGDVTFDYVLDASGRAGLLATKHHHSRRHHEVFKNVALWGYWKNTKPFGRGPAGGIGVVSIPHGWLWQIPLHDDTVSVGAVITKEHLRQQQAEGTDVTEIYHGHIAESSLISNLVSDAELSTEVKAETDYSYVTDRFAGPGYLLAGDAACFLDPLLSTGVHLAMYSALLSAASLTSILSDGVAEADALSFYEQAYRTAYERLLVLVSVFYEAYRGRDEHFYNAQRLSRREKSNLELHKAFLHITAGVEDLADAQDQDRAYDSIASELVGEGAEGGNPLANHNVNMLQPPDAPGRSLAGLYLSTEPKVTLLRAGSRKAEETEGLATTHQ